MKLRESVAGKLAYTDLKLVSQNEGAVVLHAKRGDTGNKVVIVGHCVSSDSSKKLLIANNKNTFSVPQGDFLQKCIEKAFIAPVFAEHSEELYYLMPLKFFKNTLQTTLQSYTFAERLEIAFKIAKGVLSLHNQTNIYHGSLDLSWIIAKKQDEISGYLVKIVPPLSAKMVRSALSLRKTASVYRSPDADLTKKSDIWSLGIIFYELLTGRELQTKEQVRQKPELLDNFEFGLGYKDIKQSQAVQKMLKGMLRRDAGERLSIEDVLQVLKREILRGLYGQEYSIPLIGEEKQSRKDDIRELRTAVSLGKVQQARVVLKGFVLVMRLLQNARLSLSLHYRQDFQRFMGIEYYFSELPLPVQQDFKTLPALYQELARKDKKSIRFATNGSLAFYHRAR